MKNAPIPPVSPAKPPTNTAVYTAAVAGSMPAETATGAHTSGGAVQSAALPQIAGYTVLSKIGEGGMGSVYLAEDVRLHRKVAIKTMRAELAVNTADRERFVREARAAAAVESDFIVPIWQVGEAVDGTPFIAMPYLQGEPLDARLKREPVAGVGLLVAVARDVADALTAAHAKGLIHRDIKPANIWLEGNLAATDRAQQFRRSKVLDFGLARPVDQSDAQLTASGAVIGTPAYMAPEQARGEKMDHRSDLFSLGVTLFRMATGRAPFRGTNAVAVMIALTTETPPPVCTINPDIPPALAALIDRLLCKSPAGRPQSAAEVATIVRVIIKDLTGPKPASPIFVVPGTPNRVTATTSMPRMPIASPPPHASPPAPSPAAVPPPLPTTSLPALEIEDEPEPIATTALGRQSRRLWAVGIGVGLLALLLIGWRLASPRNEQANTEGARSDERERPADPAPKPDDVNLAADRKATEWAISLGGTVYLNGDEKKDYRVKAFLPKEPFQLTHLYLDNRQLGDGTLAPLKGANHLIRLVLTRTNITDTSLANLTSENLKSLSLDSNAVLTDTALVHLKGLKNLTNLNLDNTSVTDEGLVHLKGLKNLRELNVSFTKVTAVGGQALSAELPLCAIHSRLWTFGPRK